MSVECRDTSRWFYGRLKLNGRSLVFPLPVKVEGVPRTRRSRGDSLYRRAHWKAKAAYNRIITQIEQCKDEGEIRAVLKQHAPPAEPKAIVAAPAAVQGIETLIELWRAVPTKARNERYKAQVLSQLQDFVRYVGHNFPQVTDPSQLTESHAEAYMNAKWETGCAAKTYNGSLKGLRYIFNRIKRRISLEYNIFEDIPTRRQAIIHRKPFTLEQLRQILTIAQADKDPDFYDLLVTGCCTAMRLGDCCQLRWSSVDMDQSALRVSTAKTGSQVSIPIFPLLLEVLQRRQTQRKQDDAYVFPQLSSLYRARPDAVTVRILKVLKKAGFTEEERTQARERGLRKASLYDFHALRITWVTQALMAGMPEKLVVSVTGHQSVQTVMTHYFRPTEKETFAAIFKFMPKLVVLEPEKANLK